MAYNGKLDAFDRFHSESRAGRDFAAFSLRRAKQKQTLDKWRTPSETLAKHRGPANGTNKHIY